MRQESQLQGIQCDDNSFPLDIFGFPSFLYVYGAYPYYQSFLEGHFDYQDLYLICVQLVRGDIPFWTTFLFVSCSLSSESEPFITIRSSSDCSHSWPRPKAQYMIWALNPTIAPQNSGFFPFIRGENQGFEFLRVNST